MWNLSSDDVQQAKERINRRRAEIEARYNEERQVLDAEGAVIETLERSAAEFAEKYAVKNAAEAPVDAPAPQDTSPPAEKPVAAAAPTPEPVESAPVGGDAKPGSRWRLHLGGRPDGEGTVGAIATR